jgi:glycosyltransferase involved in cell wall biosynthesis
MFCVDSGCLCGLCCEPKDVEGLRRNIQYFLDHPDEARAYGHRAAQRVNDMYAMPKVWEQMVGIWKETVQKALRE